MSEALPDVVVVHPITEPLRGSLRLPGDKSVSHRALLLGSLVGEAVDVIGLAPSGDVRSTAAALVRLGATVRLNKAKDGLTGHVAGPLREAVDVLDCGNSGTALRLLAGVCAGIDGVAVLTGDASLRGRPMARVVEPLRRMGALVDGRGGGRFAPLTVRGGGLRGITYDSPVASAQVKSCLLLAGLHATGVTKVREPGPSRDHTERMLAWLGADAGAEQGAAWVRPGPLDARPLRVPADVSAAAFWLVAASVVPGSVLALPDVGLNPTRTGAVEVLQAMGALVDSANDRTWSGEPVGDLAVTSAPLEYGVVSGDLVVRAIDELPILAVAGAIGEGLTVTEAQELRVKESDRIDGVARLLSALGGEVEVAPDGFTVGGATTLRGGVVDSGGDHRIAMAAAIAGLAAAGPVTIRGFAPVATSYPSFLDDLTAVGGRWDALA